MSADSHDIWTGGGMQAAYSTVIVVSNRSPVQFSMGSDSEIHVERSAGGAVSAVLDAVRHYNTTWIGNAVTDADRLVARDQLDALATSSVVIPHNISVQLVPVPQLLYRRYYEDVCNRVLWAAHHYLLPTSLPLTLADELSQNWQRAYHTVNRAVARETMLALVRHGTSTPVLLQDFHLFLAPKYIRSAYPDVRMAHFIHVPWPDVRYYSRLPSKIAKDIFEGMLSNTLVGFQTPRDARNFVDGAALILTGTQVRWDDGIHEGLISWQGKRTLINVYPAVTSSELREEAASYLEHDSELLELQHWLASDNKHRLILRVDRVDSTKNLVAGFQAYQRFLEAHPELQESTAFLALLIPSRHSIAEYRAYSEQTQDTIDDINNQLPFGNRKPIIARWGNNRARALWWMQWYDVLLVNSKIDGMNLVAKEGGILNARHGVILLSTTAGAYEELRGAVIGIAPDDVEAMSLNLYDALRMDAQQRQLLSERAKRYLLQEHAESWISRQLRDFEKVETK